VFDILCSHLLHNASTREDGNVFSGSIKEWKWKKDPLGEKNGTYKMLSLPLVLGECEIWSLILGEEHKTEVA
jgi:hypothetical protein